MVLEKKQLSKKILAIAASIAIAVAFMPMFGNFAYAASNDYTITSPTSIPDQTWTGEIPDLMQVPELAEITVKDSVQEGLILTRGEDFTVAANTAKVGTATATFTGIGNYEGKTFNQINFQIVEAPAPADTYEATVETANFVYDGTPLTEEEVVAQTNVVKNGNTKVAKGTSAGQYSVVVTPEKDTNVGNAGEKYQVVININGETPLKIYDETVTIAKADLQNAGVNATFAAATYDGKEQKPAVQSLTVKEGLVAPAAAEYTVAYSNNINAGDKAVATITAVAACKNYTGSADVNFTIAPLAVAEPFLDVTSPQTFTYNGKVQKPEASALGLKVYTENSKLAPEVPAGDYKVVFATEDSKAVGKYKVAVAASDSGNVTFGTVTPVEAYEITKADMSQVTVTKLRDAEVGTAVLSDFAKYFKVMLGDVALVAGTDFEVAYAEGSSKDKVGEATVELTGTGNMTGKTTGTYTNEPKKLAAEYTSAYEVVFTGAAQRPNQEKLAALTKKDAEAEGAASLTSSNYNVLNWSNNTNVGDAVVEIEGKGDYEGQTATATFKIKPAAIGTGVTVTGIAAGSYYVGCEITGATVKLADGKTTLTADDCTVTAKTIADGYLTAVTVTGKGNYTGTCDATVNVASDKLSLNNATVEGDIPAGLNSHTGATLQNFVKVKVGNTVLTNDVYAIAVEGDYALGKELTLKLTPAKDEITGTKTVTKTVVARDIAELKDSASLAATSYEYSGDKNEPAAAVAATTFTAALVAGTDFEVAYKDNINVGTATATITGKGNYTGSFTKEFKINKHKLVEGDFELVEPAASKRQFKVGAPDDLSADLTIKAASGKKFEFAASDYTISLNPGQEVKATDPAASTAIEYTLTINRNSANYVEDANGFTVSYKLVPKTVKNATITVEKSELVYAGDTAESYDYGKLEVVVDGVTLTENTDYTVKPGGDWTLPSKKGENYVTPYVEITFKGNYAGVDKTTQFSIIAAEIDLSQIKLIAPTPANCVYSRTSSVKVDANDIGKTPLPTGSWTVKYTKDGEEVTAAKDVGTYKATVWSTVDYGSKEGESVEFTITPQVCDEATFETLVSYVRVAGSVEYLGDKTQAPKLAGAMKDQFEVVEWDKTWDGDEAKKGKATIALKADANYAYDGTATLEFTWVPGDIDDADVNDYFEIPDQVYNGTALEPAVQVKKGCEFSADWVTVKYYENNVNAAKQTAKAYVVVQSPDTEKRYDVDLEGYVVFTIKPAPIADQTITVAKATYAGKAVTPKVTIKDADGALLELDKDYTVAYANNTKAGKGTATITGIKNYTGETDVQFTINKGKQKITKVTPASKTYKANKKTGKLAAKKTFTLKATATPTKGGGKVTFKKANKVGGAKIKVTKAGKVTVKKGLKKGTYKVKFKATKAANANYKKATKTVTVKIVIQ